MEYLIAGLILLLVPIFGILILAIKWLGFTDFLISSGIIILFFCFIALVTYLLTTGISQVFGG